MTAADPAVIRESFQLIRSFVPDDINELVDALEKRLLTREAQAFQRDTVDQMCEQILSGGSLADVLPFPSPGFSVKVPAFACVPDESGGLAS